MHLLPKILFKLAQTEIRGIEIDGDEQTFHLVAVLYKMLSLRANTVQTVVSIQCTQYRKQ